MIGRKLKAILCTAFMVLGLFAVCLILPAQPAYANNPNPDPDISASFTDGNFRQAVWEWLGNTGDPGTFTRQNLINRMAEKSYTLDVSGKSIGSLAGLQNFDGTGLLTLNCSTNQLTSLPDLPAGLENFNCSTNQIAYLPSTLPVSLKIWWCDNNLITAFPVSGYLPPNLASLRCYSNQISALPQLPNTLTELDCYDNQLTSLPTLPVNLEYLNCAANSLNTLPFPLPSSIKSLYCSNNQLTILPDLPSSLNYMDCNNNQITYFPTLPSGLLSCYCENNWLTSLPELPGDLRVLYCGYNKLTQLPSLPGSLTILYCYNNQLTSLPGLPNGLEKLFCNVNRLGNLPALPGSLEALDCSRNYINVFSGELRTRIDELGLTVETITPQWRFVHPGDALIVGPSTSRQLVGSDLAKQSTDNGSDWTDLNEAIDIGEFKFTSADKNVARVNESGLIEACGPGSTMIYAAYNGVDSSYTAPVIIVTVESVSGANPGVVLGAVQNPLPAGAKVSISAIVMNLGDADAAKNTVEFYIGNELVATKNVSKLKPSKSKLIKVKIAVPNQKIMTLKVKLGSSTGDVFLGNNEDQSDVNIMWPDLKGTSVATKKNLVVGKSATLTVGIYNDSIATAGPFVVRVKYKGDSIGEKKVSKLKPGAKTLSIKIAVPADFDPANDVLNVVVDADKQVAEENEDNNTMPYPIHQ